MPPDIETPRPEPDQAGAALARIYAFLLAEPARMPDQADAESAHESVDDEAAA